MHAVIDTNVLIYDTIEDSVFHDNARTILDSLSVWIIPSIVIYEYIWFFKGLKFNASEVKELLDGRVSDPRCRIVPDDGHYTQEALNILVDTSLSLALFNDMIILSVAKERRYPIITFDKKFQKRAKKFGLEVLPKEL